MDRFSRTALLMVMVGISVSIGSESGREADGRPVLTHQTETVLQVEMDASTISGLKEELAGFMELSDEAVVAMVPESSGGIRFVPCPNCDHGNVARGDFEWDWRKPGQIECSHCAAVYPGNPEYPDVHDVVVAAPDGEHRFRYYRDPESGIQAFFAARAEYNARIFLERTAQRLAQVFYATGDGSYARRAVLIMDRFAEVYPGYPYIYDFPARDVRFKPYTENRIEGVPDFRVSRWEWWAFRDVSYPIIQAFDLLDGWEDWDSLPGARERIRDDLIAGQVEHVLGLEEQFINMSPRVWRDAVYAGRVVGEPQWVHEAVKRFETMLEQFFLHDGHWMETSPSYAIQVLGQFDSLLEVARGYSDPPGYRHPDTGNRFDNLNLAEDDPKYRAIEYALRAPRLPTGRLIPLNDTWGAWERRVPYLEERERMEPVLLPGLGVAVLGGGEGKDQLHAHLNFTAGTRHKQRDALSIGLFAHGREVLPDIGYTHTRYRSWANATMSHNTVVVDGRESELDEMHSGHRLVDFYADGDRFGFATVESDVAYPELERYRRTLIQLGSNSASSYLVDVFDIRGGEQHDYLLHGSADEDSTIEVTGAKLKSFGGSLMNAGETFEAPTEEREHPGAEAIYGFIDNLRRGVPTGGLIEARMQVAAASPGGWKTFLVPVPEMEVFTGESPSIRRAQEDDALVDEYQMPCIVARRRGEGDLHTRFVAVHVPYPTDIRIQEITTREESGWLLIQIEHEDAGRDIILLSLDGEPGERIFSQIGEFGVNGRLALMRLNGGSVDFARFVGGTHVTWRDFHLEGKGTWRGEIREIRADQMGDSGFVVAESIQAPVGALVIEFPDGSERGYNVTDITSQGDETFLRVKERIGFSRADGQIKLLSYPQRIIAGERITYRISSAAHFEK